MTDVLLYDCPSCTASCSVSPDLVGLNVVCPNGTQEFTATPQDSSASDFQLPDAIPFFKSGVYTLVLLATNPGVKNRFFDFVHGPNLKQEISISKAYFKILNHFE